MRIARTSVIVAAISALVTAAAFANQLVIAHAFGASVSFDMYLAAMSLPSLVGGAFSGIFAYAMVPALVRASAVGSPERSAGAFLITIVTAVVVVGIVGVATTPITLLLIGATARTPETLLIARIGWLGVALGGVVGFFSALLNVGGRFVLPVTVAVIPYAVTTIAVLSMRGAGPATIAGGLTTGTGIVALVLLARSRELVQLKALTRADFEPVYAFARAAPFALLSVLAFSAYPVIDAFWAPRLGPASLSTLGYCQRLLIAIAGVMVAGPSVVLQPRLAAAAAKHDGATFQRDLIRGTRLTLFICAPVAVALSLLSEPLVRLAFERGAFDRADTLNVSMVLPWMLAGMVPMVVSVIVFKALFARHDVRTALYLGLLGPLVYFVGSGILSRFFGLRGISGAYALTWAVAALVGAARLRCLVREPGSSGPSTLAQLGALLAAVAVPALLARSYMLAEWGSIAFPALLTRLLVAGLAIATSYVFTALYVARVDDLRTLMTALRTRPRSPA